MSYVSDNISVQVYKPGLRLSLPGNRKAKFSNIPETHKRELVTDTKFDTNMCRTIHTSSLCQVCAHTIGFRIDGVPCKNPGDMEKGCTAEFEERTDCISSDFCQKCLEKKKKQGEK